MSHEWQQVPLGEVLRHRKEFIEIDDFQSYKRCRVQLHVQGIVLRDTVSGAEIKTKKQQVCRAGEFLVAEIDAKVGGFGIVPDDLEGAIVSSHYFLFEVNGEVLDQEFLGYYIRTPSFRDQVSAQGSTNYAAIRPRDVLSYTVPVPPLAEQLRLVARIDELASKIEEAKRLREETKEHSARITQSTIAKLIPDGVSVHRLGQLIKPGSRISYGVLVPGPDVEGGVPFVRVQDLTIDDHPTYPVKRIAADIDAQYSRTRLKGGEVLVGVVGSIGKVGSVPDSWAGSNIARAVCRIVPGPLVERDYLVLALQTKAVKDYFLDATRTLAQPTLNVGQLENTPIPLPPIPEQKAMVRRVQEVRDSLRSYNALQTATESEINALLPAILDQAFKGNL